MKHNHFGFATIGLLALGSGCGMLKNMSEMHDSTQSMSATTDGMAKTTTEMAKTTQRMAGTTNGMAKDVSFTYFDLRIGNTRQARQEALDGMEKATDEGTKMGYTSEYFAAQEYQFWKPDVEDEDSREAMKSLAIKDFFKKVREYIGNRDLFSAEATDDKTRNLYALAATLHYVNNAQLDALKSAPGEKVVTMLSMLEDGLKRKADLESGKVTEADLLPYQLEVLRQEQDAVYILRIRQIFLKAFGFVLSAESESGDEPTKNHLFGQYLVSDIFNRMWTPNLTQRNSAQINYNAIVFEYANETQTFLKTQGYDPMNDPKSKVTLFLKHMNTDFTSDSAISTPRARALVRFKKALTAAIAD